MTEFNDPLLAAVHKHAVDNKIVPSGDPGKSPEEIAAEQAAAEAATQAAAEAAEQAAAAAAVQQQIDDLAILKEKTGGLFEKWEDIKKVEFPDDNSKVLFEALQAGKLDEVRDYLNRSTEDYSKWSQEQLLMEKIKKDNPMFTPEEINAELADTYGIGADPLSEEDYELLTDAQRKAYDGEVKRKARNARRDAAIIKDSLEASKKEIALPIIKSPEPTGKVENQGPTAEEIQAAQAAWEAEVEAEVPKNKEIKFEFELGDGDNKESVSFDYKLSDDDVLDISKRLKSYVGEESDRDLSTKDLIQKLVWKDFGPKILKAALSETIAKAKEQFVERELKQIDFSNRGLSSSSQQQLSAAQLAMRQ